MLMKALKIKKPRSIEWYLHEGLLKRNPSLSIYQDIDFPPELPDDYFEPIGIEFGRNTQWVDVEVEIARWSELESVQEESFEDTTRLSPLPELDHKLPTEETASPAAPQSPIAVSPSSPAAFPAKKKLDFYAPQAN
jgi:hypothetical protein